MRFTKLLAATVVLFAFAASPAFAFLNRTDNFIKGYTFYTMLNYKDAMASFKKAERSGDPRAMYFIGLMYAESKGVEEDQSASASYFARARKIAVELAEKSDTRGMFTIATMYLDGYGINQNYAEAMRWYERGADAGDLLAR